MFCSERSSSEDAIIDHLAITSLPRNETEPIRYQILNTMSTRKREENKNNQGSVYFAQHAHRLQLLAIGILAFLRHVLRTFGTAAAGIEGWTLVSASTG
eukprot:763567-Hanusia_phi.AAC.1